MFEIQKKAKDDWTGLHIAVNNNQETTVAYLLQRGADVEAVEREGWKAIHLAACRNFAGVAEKLIFGGAYINSTDAVRMFQICLV